MIDRLFFLHFALLSFLFFHKSLTIPTQVEPVVDRQIELHEKLVLKNLDAIFANDGNEPFRLSAMPTNPSWLGFSELKPELIHSTSDYYEGNIKYAYGLGEYIYGIDNTRGLVIYRHSHNYTRITQKGIIPGFVASDYVLNGELGYFIVGGKISILDFSDRENPVSLSDQFSTYGITLLSVSGDGRLLLTRTNSQLILYDISEKSLPQPISTFSFYGSILCSKNVQVGDDRFVYCLDTSVRIFNFTDPVPYECSNYTLPQGPVTPYLTVDLWVDLSISLAYVTSRKNPNPSSLWYLDVSDRSNIVEARSKFDYFIASNLIAKIGAVVNDKMYILRSVYYYVIDDVSTNPSTDYTGYDISNNLDEFWVDPTGEIAIVPDGQDGLYAFNLSQIDAGNTPRKIGHAKVKFEYPRSMVVENEEKYAYVGDGAFGLAVVDIRNLSTARISFHAFVPGFEKTVSGLFKGDDNIMYMCAQDTLVIFNLSVVDEDGLPTILGSVEAPGPYLQRIFVDDRGEYGYGTAGGEGIYIFNVTDREHPTSITTLVTSDTANDVVAVGDFAYVAADGQYLEIFLVTDITSPVPLTPYDIPSPFGGPTLVTALADPNYLAVGEYGTYGDVAILDISNPYSIQKVYQKDERSFVWGLFTFDNFLFVCLSETAVGFRVYDVTDPSNPEMIVSNGYSSSGDFNFIRVIGNTMYTASRYDGFKIFKLFKAELTGTPTYGDCGETMIELLATDISGSKYVSFNVTVNPDERGFLDDTCDVYYCYGKMSNDSSQFCSGGQGNCVDGPNGVCECHPGYFGRECGVFMCYGVMSNASNACSGHGICWDGPTGKCNCSEDHYYDLDCSNYTCGGIFRNRSEVCSGHGKCLSFDRCVCDTGYVESSLVTCIVDSGGDDVDGGDDLSLIFIASAAGGAALIIVVLLSLLLCLALLCCACILIFGFCCCFGGIGGGGGLLSLQSTINAKRNTRNHARNSFPMTDLAEVTADGGEGPKVNINKDLFQIEFSDIKLVKLIGSGGGGAKVFLSDWNDLKVAVKVFRRNILSDETEESYEEFEREVSIMGSISHPHILRWFGCTLNRGKVGIVMEFCDNGDLGDCLLGKKIVSKDEKVRVAREIALGMKYLHDRSVIHRDLKPENVLLDNSLAAKIMDFGLSRVVEKSSRHMTKRIGTCFFMAPEITLGKEYNLKVDVFAFGVLLFIIMTSDLNPYGKEINYQVEFKVANEPEHRPNMNEETEEEWEEEHIWMLEMMKDCWSHDPEERPSFSDVCGEFRKYGKEE